MKKHWHKEAKRFFKDLHESYKFYGDQDALVLAVVDNLSAFWKASDLLHKEGLTIEANGMTRKHPACEISKNSWSAFLAGCRHLGICGNDEIKRPVGRPDGGGSFR